SVGEMNIRHTSARKLVHSASIALDPRQAAQGYFAIDRNYGDLARTFSVRGRPHFDRHLLASQAFKKLVDVISAVQLAASYGQEVLAGSHAHTGLRQRCLEVGVPVLPVVNAGDTVAIVLDGIVGPKEAVLHLLDLGAITFAHEDVPQRELAQSFLKKIAQLVPRADVEEI